MGIFGKSKAEKFIDVIEALAPVADAMSRSLEADRRRRELAAAHERARQAEHVATMERAARQAAQAQAASAAHQAFVARLERDMASARARGPIVEVRVDHEALRREEARREAERREAERRKQIVEDIILLREDVLNGTIRAAHARVDGDHALAEKYEALVAATKRLIEVKDRELITK